MTTVRIDQTENNSCGNSEGDIWSVHVDRRTKTRKKQSGQREVESEKERVEIKRMCLSGVTIDFCEDFSSMADCESDRGSLGFSVCVLAVSSFVTVVLAVLVSPIERECVW